MKKHAVLLCLLALCLTPIALPAIEPLVGPYPIYQNGPVNGQVNAWTINFGYAVTDSFHGDGSEIFGLSFWAWLLPGDIIASVELSIGSTPYGSNLFHDVVNLTESNCFGNRDGFNVCEETADLYAPRVNGTAWLTLQNASVPTGDPVYWDENSGVGCKSPGCPSRAFDNGLNSVGPTALTGTIPSEAFTIMGYQFRGSAGPGDTTPEPGSILLFGSGILGLAGILRRNVL